MSTGDEEAFRRHLANARREVVRATERAMGVHQQIGLRHGHLAELVRGLRAVRDEAEKAARVFEGRHS